MKTSGIPNATFGIVFTEKFAIRHILLNSQLHFDFFSSIIYAGINLCHIVFSRRQMVELYMINVPFT